MTRRKSLAAACAVALLAGALAAWLLRGTTTGEGVGVDVADRVSAGSQDVQALPLDQVPGLEGSGRGASAALPDDKKPAPAWLGHVVNERGEPVAGARVVLGARGGRPPRTRHNSAMSAWESSYRESPPHTVTTDADGAYQLSLTGEGGVWAQLHVEHQNFANTTVFAEVDQPVRIVLRAGGTLRLRAHDARGLGLAGVGVYVFEDAPTAVGGDLWALHVVVFGQTDERGEFLTRLAPGGYRARFTHEGYAPQDTPRLDVQLDVATSAEVELDGGVELVLRVLGDLDQPVPGARVFLGTAFGVRRQVTADQAGLARIAPLPRRPREEAAKQRQDIGYWRWRIWYRVELEGYAKHEGSQSLPADVGEFAFDVRLSRGTPLRIRVVESDGTAVPGVAIYLPTNRNSMNPVRGQEQAGTDKDGWADLGRVAGSTFTVRIRPRGVVDELVAEIALAGAPVDHVVVLGAASGHVRGRIVGADGEVLPGANVAVLPGEASDGMAISARVTPVGKNGEFDLPGTPIGDVHLLVQPAGNRIPERIEIHVTARDVTDVGTVRLRNTGRIAGQILARDGGAVGVVKVTLETRWTHPQTSGVSMLAWAESATDERGHFDFQGVPADREFELRVQSDAWVASWPWPTHVRAGDHAVRAVVKPKAEGQGAPLNLRLVDDEGPYTGPAQFVWTCPRVGQCMAMAAEEKPDGVRTVRIFTGPGTYPLEISAPGYRPTRTTFHVEDRPTDEVTTVRLDRGAVLRVRVVDGGGAPRSLVAVSLYAQWDTAGPANAETTTDADGWATLAGLEPDTRVGLRLYLSADTVFTSASAEQVAVPGEITLPLVRQGLLTVNVPRTHAQVGSMCAARLFDGSGALVYEDVRSPESLAKYKPERAVVLWVRATTGTYRLEVRVGDTTWERDVELVEGRKDSIELEDR